MHELTINYHTRSDKLEFGFLQIHFLSQLVFVKYINELCPCCSTTTTTTIRCSCIFLKDVSLTVHNCFILFLYVYIYIFKTAIYKSWKLQIVFPLENDARVLPMLRWDSGKSQISSSFFESQFARQALTSHQFDMHKFRFNSIQFNPIQFAMALKLKFYLNCGPCKCDCHCHCHCNHDNDFDHKFTFSIQVASCKFERQFKTRERLFAFFGQVRNK